MGLGGKGMRRLLDARAERPFRSVSDLRHRAGLDREQLQSLLDAGALATLFQHVNGSSRSPQHSPAQQNWVIAAVCGTVHADNHTAQTHIDFGEDASEDPRPPQQLPVLSQETCRQRQYQPMTASSSMSIHSYSISFHSGAFAAVISPLVSLVMSSRLSVRSSPANRLRRTITKMKTAKP